MKPATIIMKLTARCNLKCDYCYMFEHRDRSFLKKPAVMPFALFHTAIDDIADVAKREQWSGVRICLHGGEPTLAGRAYLERALEYTTEKLQFLNNVKFSIQTNGVLLDEKWICLFAKYRVSVGISLDGPASANDLHRLDYQKRSTYAQTVRAIRMCVEAHKTSDFHFGGILAVIDPRHSGRKAFNHFVDDLHVDWMDFLLPDANHDQPGDYHCYPSASYARFLIEVFESWLERGDPNIHVRFLESLIDLLIGGKSAVESVGGEMGHLLVIETDGSLEPLDVLRISEDGFTRQDLFVGRQSLADFFDSPLMVKLRNVSLPRVCQGCRYEKICGAGYLPHRYSRNNYFNNPSLYCTDLKVLIEHIWNRLSCFTKEKVAEGKNANDLRQVAR